MSDDHCRITVVGERAQVDLALPAAAPIGEYTAQLARMCGQPASDSRPGVWALAPAGGLTIPLDRSLSDMGVLDGQRLYLRDLSAGETDEPVVAEVAEAVAESRHPGRVSERGRAIAAAALGVAWLGASAVYLAARPGAIGSPASAGGALAFAGLALPAAAWQLRRRRTGLPDWLVLAIAITAITAMAGAFAVLGQAVTGRGALAVPAVPVAVGAGLGALLALAAVPGAASLTGLLLVTMGGVIGCVLSATHTPAVRGAAVVAVAAAVLHAMAPRAAAGLAGISFASSRPPVWEPPLVDAMMARTLRLLTLLTCVCSAALAVSLVILGGAPGPFAPALAAVVGLCLLARAANATFAWPAVSSAAAGLAGLFATLVNVGGRLPDVSWTGPALLAAGAVALVAGLRAAALAVPEDRPADPDRRTWSEVVAFVCDLAMLPLTIGVFGLFTQMTMAGRHM
jgi:type VII secretion integral membrane protein EccD